MKINIVILILVIMSVGCKSEISSKKIPPLKDLSQFIDKYYGVDYDYVFQNSYESVALMVSKELGLPAKIIFTLRPNEDLKDRKEAKKYFKSFYESLDYSMIKDGYLIYIDSTELEGPFYEMDGIEYYNPKPNSWFEIYKLDSEGNWIYVDKKRNKEANNPRNLARNYLKNM